MPAYVSPDVSPVEVSMHVPAAPPPVVFAFLTDPARYVQWMGSEADLEPVPEVGRAICVTCGPSRRYLIEIRRS